MWLVLLLVTCALVYKDSKTIGFLPQKILLRTFGTRPNFETFFNTTHRVLCTGPDVSSLYDRYARFLPQPRLRSRSTFKELFGGVCAGKDNYLLCLKTVLFHHEKKLFQHNFTGPRLGSFVPARPTSPAGFVFHNVLFLQLGVALVRGKVYALSGGGGVVEAEVALQLEPKIYLLKTELPVERLLVTKVSETETTSREQPHSVFAGHLQRLKGVSRAGERGRDLVLFALSSDNSTVTRVERPQLVVGENFVWTQSELTMTFAQYLPRTHHYTVSPCDYRFRDFKLSPTNCPTESMELLARSTVYVLVAQRFIELEKLSIVELMRLSTTGLSRGCVLLGQKLPVRSVPRVPVLFPRRWLGFEGQGRGGVQRLVELRTANFTLNFGFQLLSENSQTEFRLLNARGEKLLQLSYLSGRKAMVVSAQTLVTFAPMANELLYLRRAGSGLALYRQRGHLRRYLFLLREGWVASAAAFVLMRGRSRHVYFEGCHYRPEAQWSQLEDVLARSRLGWRPFAARHALADDRCPRAKAVVKVRFVCAKAVYALRSGSSDAKGCVHRLVFESRVFCSTRQQRRLLADTAIELNEGYCVLGPRPVELGEEL